MNKNYQTKLLKKLNNMAPDTPSLTTRKRHSTLINELFQLCPKSPFVRVTGIELVKKLNIPLSPNQKK